MASKAQSTRADAGSKESPLSPRILYLTFYNLLFAVLWATIGITAARNASIGRYKLFEVVEPLARWVQTLTLIEVLHAGIGTFAALPLLLLRTIHQTLSSIWI